MSKLSVLVTGEGSFLATQFIRAAGDVMDLTTVRRADTGSLGSRTFDAVINFACDPAYFTDAYDPDLDVDLFVANRMKGRVGHCFMLSSRLVYGQTEDLSISEAREPRPENTYAHNKVTTEQALIKLFGADVTILRLANVFGPETGRRTFAGRALESLQKNQQIILDIAPETRRDFLPLDDFARTLTRLLPAAPGGLLNLGAGLPTSVGQMASWFVEGYGQGRIRAESSETRDEFCLDITALRNIVGNVTTAGNIATQALAAGRTLKDA